VFKKLISKKFFSVLVSVVIVPFLSGKGVPDVVIQYLLTLLGGFIGVQGIVDAVAAYKSGSLKSNPPARP
jgi:uncharacterized membrane protein YqaE (UPF0057 family)